MITFENADEETLWMRVVIAVAQSDNVRDSEIPVIWADKAVVRYRERLKPKHGYRGNVQEG